MESVSGVDLDKFGRMSGGFRFLEGGPIQKDDDIMVDERFAAQRDLHAGNKLTLWNREWHVSGIFESGKLARIILPTKTVQEISGASGRLSQIFLKVDKPENLNKVIADLKANPHRAFVRAGVGCSKGPQTARHADSVCPQSGSADHRARRWR